LRTRRAILFIGLALPSLAHPRHELGQLRGSLRLLAAA
jgi:hypothetical protein